MDQKQLKELIKKGESQELDFKRTPENIGKDICGFANTNDGIILVGVSDKGDVIGTTDKKEEDVANTVYSLDKPVYPEIEKVKVDNKLVLVVKVRKSFELHTYKGYGYRRVGSTNKPMALEELVKKARELGIVKFDSQVCNGATLEDIDKKKLNWFLSEAKHKRGLEIPENTSVKEALMRLNLSRDGKITNAAILLFGKNPQNFFLQCEVKCIRFKGTDVTGRMIDMKIISDNILDQLKKAEDFIFEHIPLAAWIEDMKLQRQEKWQYPPKVIREALANAIAHRDYTSVSKVQIRMFDDRIEFWNPGLLPEEITTVDLRKKHKSIPRNPLIARHFFWVKYCEEVGTGTNRMIKRCIGWGIPEPDFEQITGDFVLTVARSKLTDELLERLNDRQKNLLEYLKEHNKITKQEYMKLTGISKTHAFRDINNLVENNIIKMEGSGRSVHYILKESVPNGPKKDRKRTEGK